ncbi:hypothetical protein D3C83_183400 [compost metagenome]
MKRKITFFAFGVKFGRFGAIGFTSAPSAPWSRRELSSDANAMPPRPMAHRLKK